MSKRPELIIGFVAPVGADVTPLCEQVAKILREFNYKAVDIRLSKLLERCATVYKPPSSGSEDDRILHLQDTGREFRGMLNNAAALGLAALVKIREERAKETRHPDEPADGFAFLLNQLKHPSEVKLLRKIYGSSFLLIAAHATKNTRENNLVRKIAESKGRDKQDEDRSSAREIIRRDDEEVGANGANKLGQNTRNTYPLADIFVNLERGQGVESDLRRFIDLIFGHPFITPRPNEVAMYSASAAALRSSDDSRQVGAVIVNVKRDGGNNITNIEVIATGMNEVPRRGGGFYWDGSTDSPDARDQWLVTYRNPADDRALTIKKDVLSELLTVFKGKDWFAPQVKEMQTTNLVKELIRNDLDGTKFMNIGEFQRQVHAEMAAIIDGARRGVAVDGHTMYVTTFPCHNCAKHIIASGIRHVVYLEPYPKSRAEMLHEEEIELESKEEGPSENSRSGAPAKVLFSPYSGIAPRQYQRFFSMVSRGKKAFLSLQDWNSKKSALSPQYLVNNASASYLMSEREEISRLPIEHFAWNPKDICPEK